LLGCKVVGGSLHLRLELMYDLLECFTVRLYHFGKVCWGFGSWLLVGLFSSEVNTVVGVGITSIGSITAAFGIGVGGSGSSIVVYSKRVPGAGDSSCGKAGSGASSIGCGGCILEVAGGIVAIVAWINIVGFECFLYEVYVMVLVDGIFLHEGTVVGNGFIC